MIMLRATRHLPLSFSPRAVRSQAAFAALAENANSAPDESLHEGGHHL